MFEEYTLSDSLDYGVCIRAGELEDNTVHDVETWVASQVLEERGTYCVGIYFEKVMNLLAVVSWAQRRGKASEHYTNGQNLYTSRMYHHDYDGDGICELLEFSNAIHYNPRKAVYYLARGRSHLFKKGDVFAAIEDFDNALNLQRSSFGYAARAICYERLGEYCEAFNDYAKAFDSSKSEVDRNIFESRMQHLFKIIEANPKTIEANKICLSYSSDKAKYYHRIGELCTEEGEFKKAFSHFKKACQLEPKNLLYCKDYENAIAHCKALEWSELGKKYVDNMKYAEAISAFEKAVELAPHSALFSSKLGLAHLAKGNYDAAIDYFSCVVRLSPSAQGYSNLARAHFKKSNFQAAKKYYESALDLEFDNIEYKRLLILLTELIERRKTQEREDELNISRQGVAEELFDFSA